MRRKTPAGPDRILALWPAALCLVVVIVLYPFAAAIGRFDGSLRGSTEGLVTGAAAGKEQGLSAEDMSARIASELSSTANLEVLLLDVSLTDLYKQGAESSPQYAALLTSEGQGVFTVDLKKSQVSRDPDTNVFQILIPEPEFTWYRDDTGTKVVAEYKAKHFDGASVDGYTGYLNTANLSTEEIENKLVGYEASAEQAKESALVQVERLARSICGNDPVIHVGFLGSKEAG